MTTDTQLMVAGSWSRRICSYNIEFAQNLAMLDHGIHQKSTALPRQNVKEDYCSIDMFEWFSGGMLVKEALPPRPEANEHLEVSKRAAGVWIEKLRDEKCCLETIQNALGHSHVIIARAHSPWHAAATPHICLRQLLIKPGHLGF
jgi:hypothetical protein